MAKKRTKMDEIMEHGSSAAKIPKPVDDVRCPYCSNHFDYNKDTKTSIRTQK